MSEEIPGAPGPGFRRRTSGKDRRVDGPSRRGLDTPHLSGRGGAGLDRDTGDVPTPTTRQASRPRGWALSLVRTLTFY